MSKMEHENAASLSIMEQIQQLIKPPPNEEEKLALRPANAKHPYYKRPGRGHNRDMCDACDEGGDLLCCDRCPSSFHLSCHDPPLIAEDIPSGNWSCHSCCMKSIPTTSSSKASSVERASVSGVTTAAGGCRTENSRPTTPSATTDLEMVPLKIRNLRKRSNSRASFCSELGSTEKFFFKLPYAVTCAMDPTKFISPLEGLIRATTLFNPKTFDVPRGMKIHRPFPGQDRVAIVPVSGNGGKKLNVRRNSKPYELDPQGLVPLPAKTCFYCRKSCKKAPLISCDFCALFFHQDCLDPPMTTVPTGIWMCPNHVENFIDNNLISTIALSERVRLWDNFAKPIDHEAVKMAFFRRVHNPNPPFRIKNPIEVRDTIEVPPIIKYHYSNPPPLLPSLRDTLRYDMVKRRKSIPNEPELISKETVSESLVKDLEALQSAKAKFREIQKELGNVHELSSSEEDDDETSVAEKSYDDTEETQLTQQKKRISKRMETITLDATPAEAEVKVENETDEHATNADAQADAYDSEEDIKFDPQIDLELRYLDVNLIKKLALQRLQQLVQQNPEIVRQYQQRTARKRVREAMDAHATFDNALMPSQVLTPENVRRLSIMFTGETSSILAQQQNINDDEPQLHPALATAAAIVAADEEERKYLPAIKTDVEKSYEIATRLELKLLRRKVRARAVLTPLGDILEDNRWFNNIELDASYFMRYRKINIGYGSTAVDLNLSLLGYCRHVSPKHATIFYDECTKTFELINYSEFGTEVNGQLYSCDFTDHGATPAKKLKKDDLELQQRVQSILDRRRGILRKQFVIEKSAKMAPSYQPECKCSVINEPPMLAGAWEGTAILTHGTLIRFGCLSFVFSVPELEMYNGQG